MFFHARIESLNGIGHFYVQRSLGVLKFIINISNLDTHPPSGGGRKNGRKPSGLPCGTPFCWERRNPATKGRRYEVAPVGEVVLANDAYWFDVARISHLTL